MDFPTGHSLDVRVHGEGVNLDNFETHDERRIIPRTSKELIVL